MKTVQLDEVVKYVNSDKWLAQEVSGRLLMTLITFMSFDKEFIKVFKVKKKKFLHFQCVIAEGNSAIMVLLKRSFLIDNLNEH